MKLVMTLLVRDEEDVLEANLTYHLEQGVDFVVVTDNESSDATPEILRRYAEMGHVHVIEQTGDLEQAKWVTQMARLAATEFGADWVINNDADEFWWPRASSLTLRDVFEAVPEDVGAVVAPRSGFVARPDESGLFADRMTVRNYRSPRHPKGLQGHPKTAHRGRADVEVGRSNHRVYGEGLRALPGWHPIVIFHYQARDLARFEKKKIHHGAALERTGLEGSSQVQRYREHVEGVRTVAQHYLEQRVVDDARVATGLADGRYVLDDRLGRFFEDRGGVDLAAHVPAGATNGGGPARRAAPEDRRAVDLADMLDDLMLGLDEMRSAEKALAAEHKRAEKAERKRRRAADRQAELERRPFGRARGHLVSVLRSLRQLPSARRTEG
jgi:hypothetical protein